MLTGQQLILDLAGIAPKGRLCFIYRAFWVWKPLRLQTLGLHLSRPLCEERNEGSGKTAGLGSDSGAFPAPCFRGWHRAPVLALSSQSGSEVQVCRKQVSV